MIIKSLEQLNFLSVEIAKKLSKSDSILLFGEIGVGKTTFTRNLINFFQEQDNVQITDVLSPTFNLLYEYEFKDFKIMHYDLYRLKNSKEIQQIGIFEETKAVMTALQEMTFYVARLKHDAQAKDKIVEEYKLERNKWCMRAQQAERRFDNAEKLIDI